MKLFTANKPCRCASLHGQLAAAGIATLTVRGVAVDMATGISASAEIVTDDKANAAAVAEVIASHDATIKPADHRDAAIASATTLDELKAAIRGK